MSVEREIISLSITMKKGNVEMIELLSEYGTDRIQSSMTSIMEHTPTYSTI